MWSIMEPLTPAMADLESSLYQRKAAATVLPISVVPWLRWLSPLWRDASVVGHSHASAGDAVTVAGSLAQAARRGVAASMVVRRRAGVGVWTARRRDRPRQSNPSQSLAESGAGIGAGAGAGTAYDSDW